MTRRSRRERDRPPASRRAPPADARTDAHCEGSPEHRRDRQSNSSSPQACPKRSTQPPNQTSQAAGKPHDRDDDKQEAGGKALGRFRGSPPANLQGDPRRAEADPSQLKRLSPTRTDSAGEISFRALQIHVSLPDSRRPVFGHGNELIRAHVRLTYQARIEANLGYRE
jgi:hypothetical protein